MKNRILVLFCQCLTLILWPLFFYTFLSFLLSFISSFISLLKWRKLISLQWLGFRERSMNDMLCFSMWTCPLCLCGLSKSHRLRESCLALKDEWKLTTVQMWACICAHTCNLQHDKLPQTHRLSLKVYLQDQETEQMLGVNFLHWIVFIMCQNQSFLSSVFITLVDLK